MSLLIPARKPPIWKTIVNLQKWIAKILFFILIALILFSAFGNKETAQILNNSYLPVISGWIGIILGFYFSRELAGIIAEKLKRAEEELDQAKIGADKSVDEAIKTINLILKDTQKENGVRRRK